ncbi:MAG: phosphotransferase [Bacteroidota bacterium]
MLNHELVPVLRAHQPSNDLLREQYGIDLSEAELLKDNFNLVFACGDFIFRFSPARKKGIAEIRSELKWLWYLTEQGLLVNQIIPAKSGGNYLVFRVDQELLYCVVFEKMQGYSVQKADWGAAHFRKLGRLTGQLHKASITFQAEVDQDFVHWHQHSKCYSFQLLPQDERQLSGLKQALEEKFLKLPKHQDNYGVIHYDIHHGNYFLLRDRPGIPLFLFDFEMTSQGWFLLDIAVILYYASNLNTTAGDQARAEFEKQFLEYFQQGYRDYFPGSSFDQGLIQDFLLYRDLLVYGYVIDAWRGRELTEKDHRFMRLLEDNIAERKVRWENTQL